MSITITFMNQQKSARLRAQDFYDYHKCLHRVYQDHFGDPAEKLDLLVPFLTEQIRN
jgi:hypothetical protein